MKNSILYITISLFLFSCGNDSSQNETSKETQTEAVVQELLSETESEHTIDNTIIDNVLETEILKDVEALNVNETNGEDDIVQNETTLKHETKELSEQAITIEAKENIEEVEIEELSNTANHESWNSILKSNVSSSGKVNYSGMKSNLSGIESYISTLESLSDQSTWSKNEKLAYWINLYNAATVRLIIQNYPTSSITNINGGKPWDKKVVTISGKTYSLNQIENDIIRPKFKEPRIHFAVNCAAISCPKIMNSAFTAEKLNYQLTKQAKSFINGSKNTVAENSIEISKIFEWYAVDFGPSIIEYLNKYSTITISSDATTTFKEYNWDLNK